VGIYFPYTAYLQDVFVCTYWKFDLGVFMVFPDTYSHGWFTLNKMRWQNIGGFGELESFSVKS
jgi:hypothetical protein